MNKFLKYLKSSKSDFVLFLILLVLANIVAHKSFIRFDLTSPKSYTLSKASKSIVKNLEEPLSIRVFFDDNLPAPYNSISQYVKDILFEYENAGNKNFSVYYMDMSKPENQELASDSGLHQIQIQEIKNDEIGFKSGYMGLVISYGDNIEIFDGITSTNSLEYNITSKITKMINTADALSSLNDNQKISATLYLSEELKNLAISNIDQVEDFVREVVNSVNKKNQNSLNFNIVSPKSDEVESIAQQYGIQKISYQTEDKNVQFAALGFVVQYEDNFRTIPLTIQRSFFGYAIDGLTDLENNLSTNLQSLLSKVSSIGYVIGHNELDHLDETYSGYLDKALQTMYKIEELDLNTSEIPTSMNTIIINGPQYDYTEEELYKIDQFLMRGGNILFFIDGMNQDGTAQYTGGQQFVKNEINLDRLLESYGIDRKKNIVMDKQCFVNNQTQYGNLNYYWAPELQKSQLAKHPITNNLGYVYMFQNGELDLTKAKENKELNVTVLARSSEKSWTMDSNIMLNPVYIASPEDDKLKSYDLVALVEGKFSSAFDSAPTSDENTENTDETLKASNHLSSSIRNGKIFISNSSYITTRNVINEQANTPVAMFILNAVDYLNGNEDLCTMRTKNLSANTLTITSGFVALFWRYFCEFGLAILVAVAGFIVWRIRSKHKRQINEKYNPNDTRTIVKEKKQVNKNEKGE